MEISGAKIVIEELINHGIDTVFGYPGGSVIHLYDELYKNSDRIKHIITAHEQGASHAADGYARATGKPSVVIATSGPGATNIVTGIATAYLDSTPMIAITGNVAISNLGTDSFQEVDIIGVTQPIVKHSFIVTKIEDLQDVIRQAFKISMSGRKGPVLIDMPKDIQMAKCHYSKKDILSICKIPESKIENIKKAAQVINESKKPYIYSGGGVIASEAHDIVLNLSKKISAPIGLSMMGLSAIPASYPLNLKMTGMHGKYSASAAKYDCDLIIAVGVRFSDRATGDKAEYIKNTKVIHIDIDNSEHNKNIIADITLCGDIKQELSMLIEEVENKENKEWIDKVNEFLEKQKTFEQNKTDFIPQNIIKKINDYTSEDTVIATDVGQHQMWVTQFYDFQKPRTFLTSGGLGTMGFGMGAVIGASVALGNKKAVLFTGDGSFGMNLSELATAVTENLPIVIVLLNNNVLGMVRQWQDVFFDGRYSATILNRKTDFVKIAEAFGAKGFRATNLNELENILNENFSSTSPILIDCILSEDEKVLPMIPPGGSIKNIITE